MSTPIHDALVSDLASAPLGRHRWCDTEERPVGDHHDDNGDGIADAAQPREGVPDTGDLVATDGDPVDVDPVPDPIDDPDHPDWVTPAREVTPVAEDADEQVSV